MKIDINRSDYGDGRFGLVFAPPCLSAFAKAGLSGNGHDWERVLRRILPKVAASTLADIQFDCESDTFIAISHNPFSLDTLTGVIEALVEDAAALRILAKEVSIET